MNSRYFTAIAVLALLYPLGKVLQFWLIGPGWIRWYISDVGWVSCVGILIAFGNMLPSSGTMLDRIKTGVGVAFAIAVCIESAQIILPKRPIKSDFIAAGDWADMAIFFLMYGVNLYLIHKMKPATPIPVAATLQPKKKRRNKKR
ncbi:MAG: hypothetical protein Q8Q36_02835 [bacterium]|nr:hypothetical protein [bacterium]